MILAKSLHYDVARNGIRGDRSRVDTSPDRFIEAVEEHGPADGDVSPPDHHNA